MLLSSATLFKGRGHYHCCNSPEEISLLGFCQLQDPTVISHILLPSLNEFTLSRMSAMAMDIYQRLQMSAPPPPSCCVYLCLHQLRSDIVCCLPSPLFHPLILFCFQTLTCQTIMLLETANMGFSC